MKFSRILAVVITVAIAAQVASTNVLAYVPTPARTTVSVQFVISDLYKIIGARVPAGHTVADVRDSSGARPAKEYAAAVSYARSQGWLPDVIPSFTSVATVEFALKVSMAIMGYRNIHTKQPAELNAARGALFAAIAKEGLDGAALSQSLTPASYDSIIGAYERQRIPIIMGSQAYGAYGGKELSKAVFLFDMIIGSREINDGYKAYKANACLGLGQIYSMVDYMMYEKSYELFQQCIRLNPSGSFGARAESDMDALPDFALSRTYKTQDAVTYQDFVAMTQHYMFYQRQTGDTLSTDTADAKGNQPAAYAAAAVHLAGPGSSREYYITKPTSWNDPVPRWWAAEYICKMRGSYNFSLVNIYPYEDTYDYPADTRMYLSRAIELGWLYEKSANEADPRGTIKRGEVYELTRRMYNPAAPEFEARPNGLAPKVHAYYTAVLGADNDLGVFARSKADMVTFLFTWFEKPSGSRLSKEGTQVLASLFTEDTEYTRFRLDAIKAAAQADCETYYAFSINNAAAGFKDSWDYLISLIKDDSKLAALCSDIVKICGKYGFDGVNLGLEFIGRDVPITTEQHTKLAKALSNALRKEGLKLIISVGAVPRDAETLQPGMFYDYTALGMAADYVHLLTYDDTSVSRYGDTGVPGAVSGLERMTRCIKYALYQIPREKLLVGFGTYAIDYTLNTKTAENITRKEADARLSKQGAAPSEPRILNDHGEDGPYREYTDGQKRRHHLAFDTRESFARRMQMVYDLGMGGVSYYWIGSENSDFNAALNDVFNKKYARPVSEADSLARADLTKAIALGFVPDYLQSAYTANITRGELFDLLRGVAEKAGKDTSYEQGQSFSDSAAPAALWAKKAGITTTDYGKPISPLRAISRQETAVTIARMASLLFGKKLDGAPQAPYSDQSSIAGWAAKEVNYVSSIGVMSGSSAGFNPHGILSRQEAIIIAMRFLEAMK